MRRIGHTGTLDPQVSGVLPLCLGRATRIVEYLQELPKTYEAEMTIGYSTDTGDASGKIIAQAQPPLLQENEIRALISSFVGEIEQIPPMFSAVRVGGQRLYDLARMGVDVVRAPRKVTIHEIEVFRMQLDLQQPKIQMKIVCSKGTYIRTLCEDIGQSLGFPSVMSFLVRTGSGSIHRDQCLTLSELERVVASGELNRRLIPIGDALSHLPKGITTERNAIYATQGKMLRACDVNTAFVCEPNLTYRIYAAENHSDEGRFIGVFRFNPEESLFVPMKIFTSAPHAWENNDEHAN
jgi:tRNA pseudouridine55 synthase